MKSNMVDRILQRRCLALVLVSAHRILQGSGFVLPAKTTHNLLRIGMNFIMFFSCEMPGLRIDALPLSTQLHETVRLLVRFVAGCFNRLPVRMVLTKY